MSVNPKNIQILEYITTAKNLEEDIKEKEQTANIISQMHDVIAQFYGEMQSVELRKSYLSASVKHDLMCQVLGECKNPVTGTITTMQNKKYKVAIIISVTEQDAPTSKSKKISWLDKIKTKIGGFYK